MTELDFNEEHLKAIIETRNEIKSMNERLTIFIDNQNDQEERIRLLEKWQWKVSGVAAAITGFFGMVGGYVISKLGVS
jgi:hypothetical protein